MGGSPVAIGPEARRTMAEGRAGFLRLLESDRTQFIYGVTSSFGPRAKLTIPPDQQRAHARAFGFRGNWGTRVRWRSTSMSVSCAASLFARLANFVAGNSRPVRSSPSGWPPCSTARCPGCRSTGRSAPARCCRWPTCCSGFRRDDLEEGRPIRFSNGSPVSAALAADTALQARHRLDHAEQVFALSVEAFGAPLDSYDDVLDDLWGDEDEASALTALRRHLEGASLHGRTLRRGACELLGAWPGPRAGAPGGHEALKRRPRVSLRSVTDNPVYVSPGREATRWDVPSRPAASTMPWRTRR